MVLKELSTVNLPQSGQVHGFSLKGLFWPDIKIHVENVIWVI
jgi:hypothetical protein